MHILLYVQYFTPFPLSYLLSLNHYFVSVYLSLFYTFYGPEKDLDLIGPEKDLDLIGPEKDRDLFGPEKEQVSFYVTLCAHTVSFIFCDTFLVIYPTVIYPIFMSKPPLSP